jgi:hypothetical protein
MILQLLVSSVIGGAVAGLASWILPLPIAVAAGTSLGAVAARLLDGRRTGGTSSWAGIIAQGFIAGTTAWLVIMSIQR